MPAFSNNTALAPAQLMIHEVWDQWGPRADLQVLRVRETLGAAQPSQATVICKRARIGWSPLDRGQLLRIYFDVERRGRTDPLFIGLVRSESVTHNAQEDDVVYELYDLRDDLNRYCVLRNHNIAPGGSVNPLRRMSFAAVAQAILDDYKRQANLPYTIRMSTSGLSQAYACEQRIQGAPCGEALDEILSQCAGEKSARWAVDYSQSGMTLSVVYPGSGARRSIYWGDDATALFTEQGVNVLGVNGTDGSEGEPNRITVVGARVLRQMSFALTPAWRSSIEIEGVVLPDWFIMENYRRYAERTLPNGDPNPHYHADAEAVGTRYKLPKVELYDEGTGRLPGEDGATSLQQPDLIEKLLGCDERAFIAMKFAQANTVWIKCDQSFAVKDGFVEFSRPLLYRAEKEELKYLFVCMENQWSATMDAASEDPQVNYWTCNNPTPTNEESADLVPIDFDTENPLEDYKVRVDKFYSDPIPGMAFTLPAYPFANPWITTGNQIVKMFCVLTDEWKSAVQDADVPGSILQINYYPHLKPQKIVGFEILPPQGGIQEEIAAFTLEHSGEAVGAWPSSVTVQICKQGWGYYGETTVSASQYDAETGSLKFKLSNQYLGYVESVEAEFVDGKKPKEVKPIMNDPALFRFYFHKEEKLDEVYFKPDAVYLTATLRDTERVTADSGPQGDERERRAIVVREDLQKHVIESGAFILDDKGAMSGRSQTSSVIRDDTARAMKLAVDTAKRGIRARGKFTAEIPHCPLHYRLGDSPSTKHRRFDSTMIVQREIDFQRNGMTLTFGE